MMLNTGRVIDARCGVPIGCLCQCAAQERTTVASHTQPLESLFICTSTSTSEMEANRSAGETTAARNDVISIAPRRQAVLGADLIVTELGSRICMLFRRHATAFVVGEISEIGIADSLSWPTS